MRVSAGPGGGPCAWCLHLDGGELPTVGDVLWEVPKILATDAEHGAYCLNEHRAFSVFVKMRLLSPCRLPSVKGSR